jgi:hypothetical protein
MLITDLPAASVVLHDFGNSFILEPDPPQAGRFLNWNQRINFILRTQFEEFSVPYCLNLLLQN